MGSSHTSKKRRGDEETRHRKDKTQQGENTARKTWQGQDIARTRHSKFSHKQRRRRNKTQREQHLQFGIGVAVAILPSLVHFRSRQYPNDLARRRRRTPTSDRLLNSKISNLLMPGTLCVPCPRAWPLPPDSAFQAVSTSQARPFSWRARFSKKRASKRKHTLALQREAVPSPKE